jgi:hypothetical protein
MTLPYPNSDRVYLTNDFITKYIYDRISELELDLSKFEIQIDRKFYYDARYVRISVYLTNLFTNIKGCQMIYASLDDDSQDTYERCTDLDKLIDNVTKIPIDDALNTIRRSYNSYKNKKENENMNTSTIDNNGVYRYSREKTPEEIELDEKINKIRAEADKKIAKLKADFKEKMEKKKRDAKSKEIHDKYQSLIDSGFNADQAYDILKTKLGEFDL